jgi:hypothetical protein
VPGWAVLPWAAEGKAMRRSTSTGNFKRRCGAEPARPGRTPSCNMCLLKHPSFVVTRRTMATPVFQGVEHKPSFHSHQVLPSEFRRCTGIKTRAARTVCLLTCFSKKTHFCAHTLLPRAQFTKASKTNQGNQANSCFLQNAGGAARGMHQKASHQRVIQNASRCPPFSGGSGGSKWSIIRSILIWNELKYSFSEKIKRS